MASPLMTSYTLNSADYKQEPLSPVKVCPDSTINNNNNNSANNNNNTMATQQQPQQPQAPAPAAVPRGRGRKANPAAGFIQVIPGQPISVARRNARERNRVKQVNNGFSTLRQHIPFTARNKKLSKVETLRCAVEYIRSLQNLLIENGGYDASLLDVDTGVTSSSPISSLESGEEHSLLSMTGASETASFEGQEPSSQTMLLAFPEYEASLRTTGGGGVLQHHHQRLYEPAAYEPPRQGSSLSPGYSDRSSASPATEVSTTGFMGVFAAAAGLKEERHDPEMLEALGGWWDLHHEQRKQTV